MIRDGWDGIGQDGMECCMISLRYLGLMYCLPRLPSSTAEIEISDSDSDTRL